MDQRRRKRVSYDAEGEVHEYTFSTYRRQPFLVDDAFKRIFLKNLDRARKKHQFLVWAYVIMPACPATPGRGACPHPHSRSESLDQAHTELHQAAIR